MEIREKVIKGEALKVKTFVQTAMEEGQDIQKVLNESLISGMDELGKKFQKKEIYLPELFIAATAMKAGLEILRPILIKKNIKRIGTVVIGTVTGDVHDIGKNLVGMVMESAGLEVIDLSTNVPPEKFVKAAIEKEADIIGISSLLTTSMSAMKGVIQAVHQSKLKERVKTIVGGAPVTQDYANEIGADGYAPDAFLAVELVKKLLEGR
jgi:5-methyltetrahydrofolate--homocysteine methyltransferase